MHSSMLFLSPTPKETRRQDGLLSHRENNLNKGDEKRKREGKVAVGEAATGSPGGDPPYIGRARPRRHQSTAASVRQIYRQGSRVRVPAVTGVPGRANPRAAVTV
ncbi:hypothetical protein ABZP36_020050 [Zizania latifolia]